MRPALLAAVLAAGALPSAAHPERAVESWPLDHATTVALVEDRRVPVVAIRVVFPAGTWSPWVRAAHAEEAFELSHRDARGTLRARARALGADLELAMDERTATLSATCPSDDLAALAALVRDVLANRDWDRRELAARRRARDLEWRLAASDPRFRLDQAAARALFEADDARRRRWERPDPVESDPARLAAARDALVRLPGRIVGFAGALSHADADRLARELLPPASRTLPPDLAVRLLPVRARPAASADLPIRGLPQVHLAGYRLGPSFDDPDYPAFLLADHVLGGHFHSRLYEALRHEDGGTYGVWTRNSGEVAPSSYGLGTFTRPDNAARAGEKLRRVLAAFHDGGLDEAERAAAASHLLGRRAFARQTPVQLLEEWCRERALGLPEGWHEEAARRAAAVSLDEVNAFVRRWYDPAAFTMLRAVPAGAR